MKTVNFKAGEQVWVRICIDGEYPVTKMRTVRGFTAYGISYEDAPWHHFTAYSFYGSGYHNNGHAIVCKRRWHVPAAIVLEWIRLTLPQRWAKRLGLEK